MTDENNKIELNLKQDGSPQVAKLTVTVIYVHILMPRRPIQLWYLQGDNRDIYRYTYNKTQNCIHVDVLAKIVSQTFQLH